MDSLEERFTRLEAYIRLELSKIASDFREELNLVATKTRSLTSFIGESIQEIERRRNDEQSIPAGTVPISSVHDTNGDSSIVDDTLAHQGQGQDKSTRHQVLPVLPPKATGVEHQSEIIPDDRPTPDDAQTEMEDELTSRNMTTDVQSHEATSWKRRERSRQVRHDPAQEEQQQADRELRERGMYGQHPSGRSPPVSSERHAGLRESGSAHKRSRPAVSQSKATRKRGSRVSVSQTDKRQKVANTTDNAEFKRKSVMPFFRNSGPIPRDFHQPTDIYDVFYDRSPTADPASVWLLTRLFFAIGSPAAFAQLRETCMTLRQSQELPKIPTVQSLRHKLQALDHLDVHFVAASILRRYYLVSLKSHRKELQNELHNFRSSRKRNARQRSAYDQVDEQPASSLAFNRADSQALTKMMREGYPDLQPTRASRQTGSNEYQTRLSALKERLRCGRNWESLQEAFAPPILLLVPTRDEYQIRDSE
ncbi:MAG: hypothetical protein M1828_002160 [Chrysothrix sp. TS-e1954]|nr:MAG: hypothetical protein M1828_002160 [Chrysothrix sp. TS-e1954]